MTFTHQAWFAVGPAIAGVAWWLRRHLRARANSGAIALPSAEAFADLPHTRRERARHAVLACRLFALGALAVACAGPETVIRSSASHPLGIDIVFALDVSRSMLAQDFMPSRLDAARRVAEAMVRRRSQDRFGIMTFAGDVQQNCPLTLDHDAVVAGLRLVNGDQREPGTALGEAIAQAANSLRHAADTGRVVILLTDGGHNAGPIDAVQAASAASAFGVRIYSVGIGSMEPAPFPTEFGQVRVALDLDERTLQRVATAGDGRYFRAVDGRALDQLSSQFDTLEPSGRIVRDITRQASVAYAFALAAVLALTAELLLSATSCRAIP